MNRNKKIILIVVGIIVAAVIVASVLWVIGRKNSLANSSENGEMISAEQEEAANDDGETEPSEADSNSNETTENVSGGTSAVTEDTGTADQELEDRVAAPYEYWLSAAVLTGISVEYPAFEPEEFYISSKTELGDRGSSSGVYVTFYIDGQEKCIYGAPLETERSDAGTKDIYSDVIGFARFDEVNVSEIPEDFSPVNIENMNELIEQSISVALYEH